MATKAAPDGGALPTVLSRHFAKIQTELAAAGIDPDTAEFEAELKRRVVLMLSELEGDVGGFDFARVLGEYYTALLNGNNDKKSACIRWLRGEYGNKTEARRATGLRTVSVIDDSNWYDHVKLICALVRRVGYAGLCVFIDEGVNLYKIVNRVSREANYEKILSMYNDTMQGRAEGMMLVFGGTPQFLEDTRRGLFSYEALRSRLCDSRFSAAENVPLRSMMGPVIRLRRLSDAELLALMMRLTSLHGQYHSWTPRVTDEEMEEFLKSALSRAGAEEMITPREIIRDYVSLLDLLLQNPEVSCRAIMGEKKDAPKEEAKSEGEKRSITIDDIVF